VQAEKGLLTCQTARLVNASGEAGVFAWACLCGWTQNGKTAAGINS
jgi:hypothetical protein